MRYFKLMAIGVVLLVLVGSILGMACAGAKGEQGPQGEQGIQGVQGDTGAQGPQGIQGIQGVQGLQGLQGEKGDKGDKGDTGLPGTGISWQGEWDNATTYSLTDAVGYQGSSYVSKQDGNANHLPTDTAWWDLWVEKGDTGEQGLQGVQGIQGEKGDTGDQGLQGVQGIQGVQGEPGPNMIVAMGNIWMTGLLQHGFGVTAASWDSDHWVVDLTISYIVSDFVTIVTPRYPDTVIGCRYNSLGGNLTVYLYDAAGNTVQGAFSFLVLQA